MHITSFGCWDCPLSALHYMIYANNIRTQYDKWLYTHIVHIKLDDAQVQLTNFKIIFRPKLYRSVVVVVVAVFFFSWFTFLLELELYWRMHCKMPIIWQETVYILYKPSQLSWISQSKSYLYADYRQHIHEHSVLNEFLFCQIHDIRLFVMPSVRFGIQLIETDLTHLIIMHFHQQITDLKHFDCSIILRLVFSIAKKNDNSFIIRAFYCSFFQLH